MDTSSFGFKVGASILKWLLSSYRITSHNIEPVLSLANANHNLVIAGMHGHIASAMHFVRTYERLTGIVSQSKDGDMAAAIFKKLGIKEIIRGSSSKGGKEALIQSLEVMKTKDCHSVIAVDGPKGPILNVKAGAVYIAKQTSKIIVPVVCSSNKFYQFNSWDKMILPYPYAKLDMYYGKPYTVSDSFEKDDVNAEIEELKNKLEELARVHCPYSL
jgi:lysophospholipid acyltransferase (LPLAT)-like uncharacterized protein